MDSNSPKPCPDCSTAAEHLENNIGHYIYCSNEDCVSRPCTRAHPTEEAAIIAWNHDETH